MFHARTMTSLFAVCAIGTLMATEAPATAAPSATVVIQGPITSMAKDGFDVESAGGYVHVTMTPQTRFQRRIPAQLSDIKAGDYVRADAHKEATGALTAAWIDVVDPELRKAIPEGQFTEVGGDIVTNAVVADVSGRTVVVKYQTKTVRIAVPAAAKVARLVADTRKDVAVGRLVTVRGVPDPEANLVAISITVEPKR